jgi:hypothetical protein
MLAFSQFVASTVYLPTSACFHNGMVVASRAPWSDVGLLRLVGFVVALILFYGGIPALFIWLAYRVWKFNR